MGDWSAYDDRPRRKRHPIRTTITVLVIIAVLGGTLYYVANFLARSYVAQFVQSGVATEFGASTSDVHVDLGKGQLLLQLAKKHISDLTVTIDKFSSASLSGAADVTATNVPLNTHDTVSTLGIAVRLGASDLLALIDTSATQAKDAVSFDSGHVRISTPTKIRGATVQVAVDYSVALQNSNLVLTPTGVTVGSHAYTPAQFKASAYGTPLHAALATRTECLAAGVPSSLKLTGASVIGQQLVITASGSNVSLGSLAVKGTCPA